MAILASLLKVARAIETKLPSRVSSDPREARRQKFAHSLNEQLMVAENAGAQKQARKRRKQPNGEFKNVEASLPIRSMFCQNSKGEWILSPRYGHQYLEFERGKCSLLVGDRKQLPEGLKKLIAATTAGELGDLLAKASQKKVKKTANTRKNGPAATAHA